MRHVSNLLLSAIASAVFATSGYAGSPREEYEYAKAAVEVAKAKQQLLQVKVSPKPRVSYPVINRAAHGHTHSHVFTDPFTGERAIHRWDHDMDGQTHRCPFCGTSQFDVDSISGPLGVTPLQSVRSAMPEYRQTPFYSGIQSGCSGPNCPAPQRDGLFKRLR